ncbi:SAM-dependent methyltransferase, partial [Paenibacillus darwinianus]
PPAAADRLVGLLSDTFRQALVKTEEADVQLLFNKKGKAAVLRKPPTAVKGAAERTHNRVKNRVIAEGEAAPFLVELGIMTKDGKVHAQKQDKYRQINRFLEMVQDVADALPQDRELTIVDFGCGKSYLTFALYHLLVVKRGMKVNITGLDLKRDVIALCTGLAAKLGYEGLRFLHGDIAEYEGLTKADMVVTLHACDTATDAALAKAVHWGASVILSVPCCQHELFGQVKNDLLGPLLSHGLLKERFASLATDAVRAQLLQAVGYKVQLLEFIDMEHTPKNILIRAVTGGKPAIQARHWEEYVHFRDGLNLSPYLEKAISDFLPAESGNG